MANAEELVTPPSIAKTASIATHGRSWGEIGATGQRSYTLPVPFLPGRSLNPDLQLSYDSSAGNGKCGLGWDLNLPAISRKTSKGVPRYTAADVMLADGTELRPALDENGQIETQIRQHRAARYSVVRYIPRLESTFDRYELWTPDDAAAGFWRVYRADGSQHCYGNNSASRIHDPDNEAHVAAWLLVEIMNAVGEHIVFEYKQDDSAPDPRFDYRAQRYLRQVCYCNKSASAELLCLEHERPQDLEWLLRLVVDYGERSVEPDAVPPFAATDEQAWPLRSDPLRQHRFGFEIGTRRLCRQLLMYNDIGAQKVLVNRLLLEYATTTLRYNQLKAARYMSYDARGKVRHTPPLEYFYAEFNLNTEPQAFLALEHMPGLNDRQPYHCVDLYGEGVPGFLCQYDNAWYYREPLRGEPGSRQIVYGPWTLLPRLPIADSEQNAVQILTDLTGDGCLDWIVARPGNSGYLRLNPDRSWSPFKAFKQFPLEFFQQLTQLGDLSGDGLDSVAQIGPKSVRVYANLRQQGFAPASHVPHVPDDALPLFSAARNELVLFGNLHASDLTGLCRVRHDRIETWANLGHGRFGKGTTLSALPLTYAQFDADRVRIADLDGSGAPALIYLCPDYFEIYANYGGNALAQEPLRVPWPEDVHYDNLCQVTFADLQGLGCASLLLTVPHMTPRHWVYHFVSERPYLLNGCNNNMGYSATLGHVSSAQAWLDEKRQLLEADQTPVCHLPFPQQLLGWLRQDDEITGNCLMQFFEYFEGRYDARERELRGFGRVQQTDSELTAGKAESGHTAPMLSKHWFHTGHCIDPVLNGTCRLDDDYTPLGATLYSRFNAVTASEVAGKPLAVDEAEIAYALSGRLLRSEVSQADDPEPAPLFAQSEIRYRVRQTHDRPSSLLVLEQESRRYQYERFMADPRCQHQVSLAWDAFGRLVHGFTIDCARRRTDADDPPFEEEDQRRAWTDSFDEQQQVSYLNESRADFLDLSDASHWLLGLPARQRSNVLILPKGALPGGLNPPQISYENLLEHQASSEWTALRQLTALSQQHYLRDDAGAVRYPPLQGPTQQAVFDKQALDAYAEVPAPFAIRDELQQLGYAPMALFFPEDPAEDRQRNLWSADSGFYTYAGAEDFYRISAVQQTASHGITRISADAHKLLTSAITLPDGCLTQIAYDYHHLLAQRITDANENIQEVLYAAGGQPLAHSFYGTEDDLPVGFDPVASYPLPADTRPTWLIENPSEALAAAASVVSSDLFSWMPQLPPEIQPAERQRWLEQGLILADGRVRASALRRLAQADGAEPILREQLRRATRQPVHSVALTADRYPDDPLRQIQIVLSHVDGFGRELQSKQLVDPGLAFVATADGDLQLDNGKPCEALAERRWRVSARVEYNHKGETIRVYRPYFLNDYRYINDSSLRQHGYHDQLFYDALGRQIRTINAKGDLAFDLLHPWFTCSYDYNDTYQGAPEQPAKRRRG
ncbi:SpvB/TcaC N-terminal domain-containing protein [Pseudomonas sp. efr-133-TYG-5]|uniref:SpvB/TcaC N-terminal domain-containing protein n=1 Tax=Pseudomonas sp. efr-133-TYG-5 TaxID=3040310 RepID=UPI002552D49B|nr:SpvB/TcaC N-terminal domain-containing protein [Pseudomonas sp. efr-133-TYG-5]